MVSNLIQSLQNASLYVHEVSKFEILETHISWVLLTGQYAYKIKKPVKFEFVDFTCLEKRRFYCYEELRLNRRLAPAMYLDVCKISGTHDKPVIDGAGPAIEYMVKMKQFEQRKLLDNLVNQNQIDQQHIHSLANTIAAFHQTIEAAGQNSSYGKPEQVYHWVEQNFQQTKPLLQTTSQRIQLRQLHDWTLQTYHNLEEELTKRKLAAFVRECHGDLHLGNIALIDDELTVFDGIDFNEELRWVDVISEIAFLMMDLSDKGHPAMANTFLDQYLAVTGDYDGLCALPFYLVYRCMVRAKIDLIRYTQQSQTQHHSHWVKREYQSYIDLALSYTSQHRPTLFITHGLAGSGKSTLASNIVRELGVVRIRSDVERKRIFGLSAQQASASGIGDGIYTSHATHKTYRHLAAVCEKVLKSGYSVVIDAGFLQQWQRFMFQQLAHKLDVNYLILDLKAPVGELHKRIKSRLRKHQDPSEANQQVLKAQLVKQQVLTSDERACSITVDSMSKEFKKN